MGKYELKNITYCKLQDESDFIGYEIARQLKNIANELTELNNKIGWKVSSDDPF